MAVDTQENQTTKGYNVLTDFAFGKRGAEQRHSTSTPLYSQSQSSAPPRLLSQYDLPLYGVRSIHASARRAYKKIDRWSIKARSARVYREHAKVAAIRQRRSIRTSVQRATGSNVRTRVGNDSRDIPRLHCHQHERASFSELSV